jgi:hypothetical protein
MLLTSDVKREWVFIFYAKVIYSGFAESSHDRNEDGKIA